MIKRIMVPLDGSDLAEQALPLASSLASAYDAEVLLASVIVAVEHYDGEDVGLVDEKGRLAAERYLATKEAYLTRKGVRVRATVAGGRPHVVISSLCDLEEVDLVVMTTHGRSGVSRWTLGSVADKVLRTTSTPLILIHPSVHGTTPETVARIVVPLDGSELAEAALNEAERMAKRMNASLHLVRAVVPPAVMFGSEYVPGAAPAIDQVESDAREYLEELAMSLNERGVTTTTEVRTGIPAEVILAEASEPGDLVAMSTHGRSGVDRWFLGSVADAVVRHGDIPVLVVRSWVTLEKQEYATPLVVAGIPPVIPVPELSEQEEPAAAGERKPARGIHRTEAQGRQSH
jgi:nucleotide-binding universal stress UspA family protein